MVMNRRRTMLAKRKRLLSRLRIRGTSTVSLHERFSQVPQEKDNSQLTFDPGRLAHRKSSLRRTGLWTRLGWLKITQQLFGFWSFKNKYGWRARFSGRSLKTPLVRRRPSTRNFRNQKAGGVGRRKDRTLQGPTTGQSSTDAGLGPRCVLLPGHWVIPSASQPGPEPSDEPGFLPPVCSPAVSGGRSRWKIPLLTRRELDAQLDAYMSTSRSRLDAELDEYMSMAPARLDAELDEYMCQAGQTD